MAVSTIGKNILSVPVAEYKQRLESLPTEYSFSIPWTGKRVVFEQVNAPVKKATVFVLDNDECIGAWSLSSAIHDVFAGYIPTHTGISVSECTRVFKDCLVKHYLSNGGARPGTKDTLKMIKSYKDAGLIDRVVMFTSATNNNNWVNCLKECLEQYAGVEGMYDLVLHKDNTDATTAPNGATFKSMDLVLERLELRKENTKIVVIDDRPENIMGEGVRVVVSPYRHIVAEKNLDELIDDILDTLQRIYTPGIEVKTYAPQLFRKMIKNLILVDSNGRKEEIKINISKKSPLNQLSDTSLMEQGATTFLDHIAPTPLTRSTSNQIPPPAPLTRFISV